MLSKTHLQLKEIVRFYEKLKNSSLLSDVICLRKVLLHVFNSFICSKNLICLIVNKDYILSHLWVCRDCIVCN
jgi:hypothetical protein